MATHHVPLNPGGESPWLLRWGSQVHPSSVRAKREPGGCTSPLAGRARTWREVIRTLIAVPPRG